MALTAAEERILNSIRVPSENDPSHPEFPPDNPRFPATPTYKIKVPEFSNVWLKDESVNPTGTHKDRMAWEMVVTYRNFLLAKKRGQISTLPQLSLITSGSAGIAIQTMLQKYGLPNLKVLVDIEMKREIKQALERARCEVYETDLSKKALDWKDILSLTNNRNGLDVTSDESLNPTTRYYDWMSYEIINENPDYVFVPFGTGTLYENILNIMRREVTAHRHDPRFHGNAKSIGHCNVFGATTNNPNSTADKLYSPHLPFAHYDDQWISYYRYSGYCGKESAVYLLEEKFLDEALALAEKQGIATESSGIAGLALLLQLAKIVPKQKKNLIINTGKTRYPTSSSPSP